MVEQLHWIWNHLATLAIAACAFLVIERRSPAVAGQRIARDGVLTDLFFSFANPLLVAPVNAILVTQLLVGLEALLGLERLGALQGRVASWPVLAQLAGALVVSDLASYWKHRVFHSRLLWPLHAVHHSATEIDWLTNERDHPLQALGTTFALSAVLALCGFEAENVGLVMGFRALYSQFTHANVTWSFGPLARLFVSPNMHRWHHARDARILDKNFAVVFAFWDVLFGSYLVPDGRPASFGLVDRENPRSVWQALRHPLEYLGLGG